MAPKKRSGVLECGSLKIPERPETPIVSLPSASVPCSPDNTSLNPKASPGEREHTADTLPCKLLQRDNLEAPCPARIACCCTLQTCCRCRRLIHGLLGLLDSFSARYHELIQVDDVAIRGPPPCLLSPSLPACTTAYPPLHL